MLSMTHEKAIEQSLQVRWEVRECFAKDCWCRIVVPIEPIKYTYTLSDGTTREETIDEIISAASVNKATAEYIVRIHNAKIDRLEALDRLSALDQEMGLA